MVQFGDKNCSSMLALCTHAAGDAYNYANRVESHKALFEAEKPCSPPRYYSALFSCVEPPRSYSALIVCGENPQIWMAAKAGLCSRRAFVIRDAPGKRQAGEIFQKYEQDGMEAF